MGIHVPNFIIFTRDFKIKNMNTECPFCHPDIKKYNFSTSKNFLAIYNKKPILPGHSLIIPKSHYTSLLDLPIDMIGEMMEFSVRAVKILMKAFKAEAFDWTIQDGIAAGQTVPHLHLHLIPRVTNDLPSPGDWFMELEKQKVIDSEQRVALSEDQMVEMVNHIRKYT